MAEACSGIRSFQLVHERSMIAHARTYIIALCFYALLQSASALPKCGISTAISPQGNYKLVLSDTAELFVYRVSVMLREQEVMHYIFKGELVTAYWSPLGNMLQSIITTDVDGTLGLSDLKMVQSCDRLVQCAPLLTIDTPTRNVRRRFLRRLIMK